MPRARAPRLGPRPSDFAIALAALLFVASATARAADCASPVFPLPQTYGVGAGPTAVTTADFSGDGVLDLYIQAEMVKAFITSTEYRNRFGQP